MELNSNDNKYLQAKERVGELKKFYSNLTTYCLGIGFLAAINYWSNGWAYKWFLWAAFGWGIGVAIHAFKTFKLTNILFGKDWEEKKIKEIMDKENDQSKWK